VARKPSPKRASKKRGQETTRGSARRELIAIQKRIYKRLKREIHASLAEVAGNVQIYLEEYERELNGSHAPCTRDDLLVSALSADIVYVGDYHTLKQSQKTLVKLLVAACKARPEVTLALELVHSKDQEHLDAYMRGEIDENEFQSRIKYEETWGFDWRNYREIFHIARKRGARLVGINSDPRGHRRDHLLERDFQAAEVVVREVLSRPRALVLVFDGDLHVARDHLPLVVDSLLERRQAKKREKTVVHQNAEAIYWELAKRGMEQEVSIVRLDRDAFCVINASPIEKLQSYLNWQSARDELEPAMDSDWAEILAPESDESDEDISSGADYTEQFLGIVQTLARFLQIDRDDLDDFELYTVADLDLFEKLAERFTKAELAGLRKQVEASESYFIPRGNIIYLADLSVSHAAEEATHFLHWKCSEMREPDRDDPFASFYLRTLTEALGFMGSLVVDHKRECWRVEDCEKFVQNKTKRSTRFTPEDRFQLAACVLVLAHKKSEEHYAATKKWRKPVKIYEQPPLLDLRVTHMLGHMLGERLYAALVAGTIEKSAIRELFFEKHDTRASAFERYLDLVARTQNLAPERPRSGSPL
jgi:hypothetical protein